MIKQPQKKVGVVRGPLAATVSKAGPKSLTPGPMKLPSKKSENMGFDPAVPLVNTSKAGWAKPTPTTPLADAEAQKPDISAAPLPTSSVWGRKAGPDWTAPSARLDAARESEFPLPSAAAPVPKPAPPPADAKPAAPFRAAGAAGVKSSTMYDWATDDANAEMDFNQPLFVGQRMAADGSNSRPAGTATPAAPASGPSLASRAAPDAKPTWAAERQREREREKERPQDDRIDSYRAMDRTEKLSRAMGPSPALPLLREKEKTRPERQHIPASGPRVLQPNPVPLRSGTAWATPTSVAPVPPTLPGQWPEPQNLSALQEMEQQAARERAAAEKETQRRQQEEQARRAQTEQEAQDRQEESRKLREQLREQKESMTHLAMQAAEKRRQEDEAEEQARKQRLQEKLAALERQAQAEKEKDRPPPPPPPAAPAAPEEAGPRGKGAAPQAWPGRSEERERERRGAGAEEREREREKEREEKPNPWTQRMQNATPSLLLQKAEALEAGEGKGKGKGKGKGRGKGRHQPEAEGEHEGRPRPGAHQWKIKEEATAADQVDAAAPDRPVGKGKGGKGRAWQGAPADGDAAADTEGRPKRYSEAPGPDWGLARAGDRVPQPDLPEPAAEGDLEAEDGAGGKGRPAKGGRGRGGGGRGLWDPYQEERREGRVPQAFAQEDGFRGGKGLLRGVKGAGRGDVNRYRDGTEEDAYQRDTLLSSSDSEEAVPQDVPATAGGRRRKNLVPRGVVPLFSGPGVALAAYGVAGRGCGLRARALQLDGGFHHFVLECDGRRDIL